MGEKRLTETDKRNLPSFVKEQGRLADSTGDRPVLFDMSSSGQAEKFELFFKKNQILKIVDNYEEQLAELFISENAQLYKADISVKRESIKDYLKDHYGVKEPWQVGSWVYYPWSGMLLHTLEEELFWRLKTIRNRILIEDAEQQRLREFSVGCAGLSVGSNGAAAISLISGSKRIKLADGAVFSGSNLNRVRAKLADIGENKALAIGRELYEMNPYLKVDVMQEPVNKTNVADFFDKPWKVNVVIDEIDDIGAKVLLRLEAKKRKIPLIMVTEPGDSIILDVERYDIDENLQPFNGLAGDLSEFDFSKPLLDREKIKLMMKIISVDNLPYRDQKAMLKVGSQMPSPPQLGSTATAAGGIIAYAVRRIACGDPIKSGRTVLNLDEIFMEKNYQKQQTRLQKDHSKTIRNILKSM